jgi:hypothetical protein
LSVVEPHLVKDRMDLTGARWGLPGRRDNPHTARHRQQRRLRRLLALPPRPGTPPRPRDPLRPRRHPTGSVRSLQKSRTLSIISRSAALWSCIRRGSGRCGCAGRRDPC